jgi:hypothetical protein
MIKNRDAAKRVSDLMLDLFARVDQSRSMVKETCSGEDHVAYVRATSGVVGAIALDVLEPLYKQHPELKPANWGDN